MPPSTGPIITGPGMPDGLSDSTQPGEFGFGDPSTPGVTGSVPGGRAGGRRSGSRTDPGRRRGVSRRGNNQPSHDAGDPLWGELEEAPRADLPDGRKLEHRGRLYRLYIRSAMVLAPVLLIANLLLLGQDNTPAPVAPSGLSDTANRSVAQVSVERWLAARPSPLPSGYVVGWDGAKRVADAPADEKGGASPYRLTAHTFTVATKGDTSRTYTVQVLLATSSIGGAVPVGEPALIPQPSTNDADLAGASRWPSLPSAAVSDAVESTVKLWAKAFTSGDADELRIAVGDPAKKHTYLPLAGVVLADTTVGEAAALWAAGHPTTDEQAAGTPPNRVVVSVELRLLWASDLQADEPPSTSDAPVVTYDVVVAGANTASPRVVAWGGPGTGPTLKAFSNAVTTTDVVESGLGAGAGVADGLPSSPSPSPSRADAGAGGGR